MEKVAKTLTEILDNPIVSKALNRSKPIEPLAEETISKWAVDLEKRKPAPAYLEDLDGAPVYMGTDFDLFTFLNALGQRGAVITIPTYHNMRETVLRSDQKVLSKENRNGKVTALISNKDVHSFSIRIIDKNVAQIMPDGKEIPGAPRNFAVVDDFGDLYSGWKKIEFDPDAQENEFFTKNRLWNNEKIVEFDNFVHPSLAFAFFGSRYLSTKTLVERADDEAHYYRDISKQLVKEGIVLRSEKDVEFGNSVFTAKDGDVEKLKVPNLESRLVLPAFCGNYLIYGESVDSSLQLYSNMPNDKKEKEKILRYCTNRAKYLTYTLKPNLQTPARAVELAFFLHGFCKSREYGNERTPGWGIPKWIRNYREAPKSKIDWNALPLAKNFILLYRLRETLKERRLHDSF